MTRLKGPKQLPIPVHGPLWVNRRKSRSKRWFYTRRHTKCQVAEIKVRSRWSFSITCEISSIRGVVSGRHATWYHTMSMVDASWLFVVRRGGSWFVAERAGRASWTNNLAVARGRGGWSVGGRHATWVSVVSLQAHVIRSSTHVMRSAFVLSDIRVRADVTSN